MAKKTWAEKLQSGHPAHVVVLQKRMMGMEPGTRLYIATPIQVRDYIKSIPPGETRTLGRLRLDLAAANGADTTCPLTSGIFARIAAEAALDELSCGAPESAITPFWRLIDPTSPWPEN